MAKDLGTVLERLYRQRFTDSELERMRGVWRVLVGSFFQKYVGEGSTVVDIGAGACLFLNEVRAARRIAIDANPDTVKRAAPGVEVVATSRITLEELEDGSVDVFFVSNFLEHLPDYVAVLELLMACREKLKPGGSLLVLQPNFRLEPRRYFDFIDHTMVLTDRSLAEGLTASGFSIREMRPRFLPFTSKSRLPKAGWLVEVYLRVRPLQWIFGKQTFVHAVKEPGGGA